MSESVKCPDRLYSLDILRGFASLSIVFWHWQHFFIGTTLKSTFKVEDQPLFNIFFLFYNSGDLAVNLFFSLSGFIFFWLYPQRIYHNIVSAKDFFILRFSRLYPLHLITLIVVALGQLNFSKIIGYAFIYKENDIFHFILNLFLMSSVGLERGYSFNAPIWSVSVECCLYAMFFVLCKFIKPNSLMVGLISLLGFSIIYQRYIPIGRGVGSFFMGGFIYYLHIYILKSNSRKIIVNLLLLLSFLLWISTIYWSFKNWSLSSLIGIPLGSKYPILILFPITILTLATAETQCGIFTKEMGFIGDVSYSLYLWHFPLQLLFLTTTSLIGVDVVTFKSSTMLLGFFCLLITISLISYYYIEIPLQRWLRSYLMLGYTR